MPAASRRQFLKTTAAGAVALGSLPTPAAEVASPDGIPAHQPKIVQGLHGYPASHSVTAGQSIEFKFSSDVPYRLEICRLGTQVDDPKGDEVVHDAGGFRARTQPIFPGSYVHIDRRLRGVRTSLSLEAWVRPWSLDRLQGVVSQEDKEDSSGFALGVGKDGYVGFYVGDGVSPDEAVVHRTEPGVLKRGRWHHVVATFDGRLKRVFVDGVPRGEWPFASVLRPGSHPLRLGAMGERGATTRFLDGDLAMVVLYGTALTPTQIADRFRERGRQPADSNDVLGCWTFEEERGEVVGDRSRHRRTGRLINHGTWMIGGPSFEGDRKSVV